MTLDKKALEHAGHLHTGIDLLHDPTRNKGTAFTATEREQLGLLGLLPPRVNSVAEQVDRVMENFHGCSDDLSKYIFLNALQERNETLFYRVLIENLEMMLPIVYTPTVGEACQKFGHIFRRPRGLFVSAEDRGRITELLHNWPTRDVRVIVVTDGERILGLGDQGADGMGIPVGKLNLYTACAGVDPSACLPVTLDVGTNNSALLADPLYIGLKQSRLEGEAYDSFVEEFIRAVQEVFPSCLVQFEDFANKNAFRMLSKYRDRVCTFNDDIQGTAAVTYSGVVSALRTTDGELRDQKTLFLGAGEAGIGIADLMVASLVQGGVPENEARRRCWFVDSRGMVVAGRGHLTEQKLRYAHEHPGALDLAAAVKDLRPSVLVGVSGQPQTFTQPVVEMMSEFNERPIIFALSNPTSKSECTAEQAYTWSGGRAIFASGSPFPPVEYDGHTLVPGQGNNSYIFPGVGLGVLASGARLVTDEMFSAAAHALCEQVTAAERDLGCIYPALSRIREVSAHIATAVAEVAYARDLASLPHPADMKEYVLSHMYEPSYSSYV